jgi:hypothetical protein
MCERLHTSPVVQKMQGGQKTPWNWRLFGPGPCWRRKKPKPLTAGASWHRAEVSGQFGPFRSASLWGRTPLSASAPSGDLFIYAKDLFVAASHWLVQKMTARDWRPCGTGGSIEAAAVRYALVDDRPVGVRNDAVIRLGAIDDAGLPILLRHLATTFHVERFS